MFEAGLRTGTLNRSFAFTETKMLKQEKHSETHEDVYKKHTLVEEKSVKVGANTSDKG